LGAAPPEGGTTDATEFGRQIPLGHFSPGGAKNDLQKKESTMLPYILSLSKGRRNGIKIPGCTSAPRMQCGCGSAHS
jgi:hypothetical protein